MCTSMCTSGATLWGARPANRESRPRNLGRPSGGPLTLFVRWVGNRSRFHGRLIRGRLLVACVSVWLIGFAVASGQTDPPNASSITAGNATGDTDSRPTLYVTATAHLDTQWLWTIQDTIEEYIPDTLRGNFALFDKFPNYTFSFEGSFRYMLAKEYYPQDYARLK